MDFPAAQKKSIVNRNGAVYNFNKKGKKTPIFFERRGCPWMIPGLESFLQQ